MKRWRFCTHLQAGLTSPRTEQYLKALQHLTSLFIVNTVIVGGHIIRFVGRSHITRPEFWIGEIFLKKKIFFHKYLRIWR